MITPAPLKYRITHTTKYNYDAPVPVCHNVVYLSPRQTINQECSKHHLSVTPKPDMKSKRTDYFGNHAESFAVATSHRLLQITATSNVTVYAKPPFHPSSNDKWESVRDKLVVDRTRNGLDTFQFVFPSPLIPNLPQLAAYAKPSFTPGRPILEAVRELNTRIYTDIKYDPKATHVGTPVSEVFEIKRGVCQDLAHLMLGCLRPMGLAGRYVSGYLRTLPPEGKPRLVGADASHAWVSVYCGEAGWIDFDPTNNSLPQQDHVTVAWGRDFGDVCPVAGMFTGGGNHQLSVSVDVATLD